MTRVDPDHALRLTDSKGTRGRRTYRALLVSGALAPLTLGATMIVHGDWQSALWPVAGLAAGAFLLGLIRLLAIGERRASPAPRAARDRALVQPATAMESRREAALSPVAPPRPGAAGAARRSAAVPQAP
jgi:hypothetical protein